MWIEMELEAARAANPTSHSALTSLLCSRALNAPFPTRLDYNQSYQVHIQYHLKGEYASRGESVKFVDS